MGAGKDQEKPRAEEVETQPLDETRGSYYAPLVDICETDEAIVVTADMPGVDRSGVEVKIEGGFLTLLGRVTRKSVKDVTQLYEEFVPGDYYRAFRLGADIDEGGVSAEMKNGVLTVTLRKSERARVRRIDVT
jgi:HSP20 family molecular chaperone IbpA